jgi:hypothetical protein
VVHWRRALKGRKDFFLEKKQAFLPLALPAAAYLRSYVFLRKTCFLAPAQIVDSPAWSP